MPKVTWTAQAEAELKALVSDPAVREQLKLHAEATLHYIPHPTAYPADEGAEDGIMWHRGVAHGRYTEQEEQDNGPRTTSSFTGRLIPQGSRLSASAATTRSPAGN